MGNDISILTEQDIRSKIYTIRGMQVMLDSDLAELYGVETKNLNKAVNRNIERFPERFRFQLNTEESQNLRFQIGTSSEHGGRRYLPFVFTEQGVSMLSAVLKSDTAIRVSILIIDAFVEMKKFISTKANIFQRFNNIELKLIENDEKFKRVFEAIESKEIKPQQGIFFDGQIFDAYVFVSKLIKSAKTSIILIDNYVDESVLTLLSKRKSNCIATIYTKTISKKLQLDSNKHNQQYAPVEIKEFKNAHDRFLILDNKTIYHIGASLKDLGKKWFAFSKFDKSFIIDVLGKLK